MEKKKYIKASIQVVNLQADFTLLTNSLGYTDSPTNADQLSKKCFIYDWDDEEDDEN